MNPWAGLGGLPRTSWLLALATLVNRAGVMVRPFLVLYLTQHLHFTPEDAGAMLALYGATTLVAAPLSGRLCDRFSARMVLRGTLLISGAMILLYPLATELWQVAVATVLFALFNEMPRPALMTLVADVAPPERRKQAFVLSRLAINLGLSIGPAAGGLLAEHSFLTLFLVDAASNVAAATVLLFTALPRGQVLERRPELAVRSGLLRDPRLQLFFFATALNAVVFFQHDSTLALVMTARLGMPKAAFGLNIAVNTLLIVLLEVMVNTRTQEWPHKKSLVAGALLCAFGFGGYALVRQVSVAGAGFPAVLLTTPWLSIAACTVVWTFGEMLLMPAMSAYVHDLAPRERRGSYMATLSLAFGLGLTVGPWFGTHVLARFGVVTLWCVMFLVALASTFLYGRLPDDRKLKAEQPP